MKTSDEIAENLFERRDEYVKEQKIKKSRMRKALVSTAAVLAVAVIGAGVWKAGVFKSNIAPEAPGFEAQEKTAEAVTLAQNEENNAKTEKPTATAAEGVNRTEDNKENPTTTAAENNNNKKDKNNDSPRVTDYYGNDVITGYDGEASYGMPCCVMPENGAYSLSYPVQWSVNKYGAEKKYQLSITIVKNGDGVGEAEKSKELKRLKDAGCDVKKYTLWTYAGADAHKETYTQLGGVFTKKQLETLFTGREYGYFFDFMNNDDSSPAEVADGTEFFEKTTKKGEIYSWN